jgi:uncharacterized membrane protein required for colicin V production
MITFAMSNQVQDFLKNAPFSYIDAIVLAWLVIGIFRGRKMGMTQEIIPTARWLCIVIVGGMFYKPLSLVLFENTAGAFNLLWARITAYLLIAFASAIVFVLIKKALGDRLTGSDLFGRWEYYLGMLAGLIRFACMLLAILAVMHARIVTQKELDDINAQMKKNLDDIHPPRYVYGSIEQAIFVQSFSGKVVTDNLSDILIETVTPTETSKPESQKKKLQDAIDNPLGGQRK